MLYPMIVDCRNVCEFLVPDASGLASRAKQIPAVIKTSLEKVQDVVHDTMLFDMGVQAYHHELICFRLRQATQYAMLY